MPIEFLKFQEQLCSRYLTIALLIEQAQQFFGHLYSLTFIWAGGHGFHALHEAFVTGTRTDDVYFEIS